MNKRKEEQPQKRNIFLVYYGSWISDKTCGCLYYIISLISYIQVYIYHFHGVFCYYFAFFLLLRSMQNTFYNLKRLNRFNYNNPRSIIITIFHTESVHFLNWKVYQLKCISLIKLTSTLNTLFSLERNLFHWEEDWNQSQRQCTKSAQKNASKVILLYRCLCLS